MSRRFVQLTVLAGIVAMFGANCALEHPDLPPPQVFDCDATIRDSAGRIERVATSQPAWTAGGRLITRVCTAVEFPEAVPGYWLQRLRRVTESDPALASRGPWCVERLSCAATGPASPTAACPEHLTGLPPLDTCPNIPSCLEITPGPDPAEPGFESLIAFGSVATGGAVSRLVTIKNVCSSPVRLRLDPRFQGAHPEDFTLEFPGCAPRTGETQGRELATLESCRFQATFRPRAAGARGARLVVGHDLRMNQQIALRGTGEGGTLAAPSDVCVAGPLSPTADCRGGATPFRPVMLLNPGTRPVAVQRLTAQAPNGQFQTIGPAPPFRVDPGSVVELQVRWCRTGADSDVRGALTFTTDGTPAVVFTNVDRRVGGCP